MAQWLKKSVEEEELVAMAKEGFRAMFAGTIRGETVSKIAGKFCCCRYSGG